MKLPKLLLAALTATGLTLSPLPALAVSSDNAAFANGKDAVNKSGKEAELSAEWKKLADDKTPGTKTPEELKSLLRQTTQRVMVINALQDKAGKETGKQLANQFVDKLLGSGSQEETQSVLVVLKDQLGTVSVANQASNLADVDRVAKDFVGKYHGKLRRTFGLLFKGFSLEVPTAQLPAIQQDPRVESVKPINIYEPLMSSAAPLSNSPEARQDFGVSGEGVVVSIIDTGIDLKHDAMKLDEAAKQKAKLTPAGSEFTYKVPYAKNFVDINSEVADINGSMHGMHVGGIVAANGTGTKKPEVNGIAPNAQLLNMKVFSNEPKRGSGAASDNIIAAIEESVKHGADIINMSLGASNGFKSDESGEQLAIRKATEAGVEVVVAAGNEGTSFSLMGDPADISGLKDNGSIGSPSTGTYGLSVASIDNAATMAKSLTFNDTKNFVSYQLQAGKGPFEKRGIVDGGLGKPEQIPADAKDKYVLIQRGELAFSDKAKNAFAKGAYGVLIYNNVDDGVPGMAGLDQYKDGKNPVAGLSKADGQKLLAELKKAAGSQVKLEDTDMAAPVATKLTPSSFTSWGTPSDLSFKPQIAGIGGKVTSTLNNNEYGEMSGTSMATPYVSGVLALMRGKLAKDLGKEPKDLTQNERIELNKRARIALANTAQVLASGGTKVTLGSSAVPFTPRQMGAGLVDTLSAMKTKVYATATAGSSYFDGTPWIELREMKGDKNFSVTLRNEGDSPASFKVGATCVLTEVQEIGKPISTTCSNNEAVVANGGLVVVPAHGAQTVNFTAHVDGGSDHWYSGFVQFDSQNDSEQPDLSLPFLGFVGNWNAEKIIDTPIYDLSKDQTKPATLDTKWNEMLSAAVGKENLGEVPNIPYTGLVSNIPGFFGISQNFLMVSGMNYVSPGNADGTKDVVIPQLALLRNVRELKGKILDERGNTLQTKGVDRNISRAMLADVIGNPEHKFDYSPAEMSFDGKMWDPEKRDFTKDIPEGKYYYQIDAYLEKGNENWKQTIKMPFFVDNTAPTLEVLKVDSHTPAKVTAKIMDKGLLALLVITDKGDLCKVEDPDLPAENTAEAENAAEKPVCVAKKTGKNGEESTWEITVDDPKLIHHIIMSAVDKAGNSSEEKIVPLKSTSDGNYISVPAASQFNGEKINDGTSYSEDWSVEETPLVKDGKINFDGTVKGKDITKVQVGNQVVEVKDGKFQISLPIKEGINEYKFEGINAQGKVLDTLNSEITYDTLKPTIHLEKPADPSNTPVEKNDKGEDVVNIVGKLTDESEDGCAKSFVRVDWDKYPVDPKTCTFNIKVPVKPDTTKLALRASDGVNGQTNPVIELKLAGRTSPDPSPTPNPSEPPKPAEVAFKLKDNIGLPDRYLKVVTLVDDEGKPNPDLLVDEKTKHLKNDPFTFVYKGSFTVRPKKFTVADKAVELTCKDGDKNCSFSVEIPLDPNNIRTKVNVTIQDNKGESFYNSAVELLFDRELPALALRTPELNQDGAVYLKEMPNNKNLVFAGTVSDNGYGYTFSINGDVVLAHFDLDTPGATANQEDFTKLVKINKSGDAVFLKVEDSFGHHITRVVPVIIDDKAPEAALQGVDNNGTVNPDAPLGVVANDDNLASLTYVLDNGEPVNRNVNVIPHENAKILVGQGDGEELKSNNGTEREKEIFAALPLPLTVGEHTLKVVAKDKAGNVVTKIFKFTVKDPAADNQPTPNPHPVTPVTPGDNGNGSNAPARIFGPDRVDTALAAWKDLNTKEAVLVGYTGQIDALTATPFASALHAGILYSHVDHLDAAVAKALQEQGVTEVTLVGGSQHLSEQVLTDLQKLGIRAKRLAGADRYATAVAVADAYVARTGENPQNIGKIIASGTNFADALVSGPLAKRLHGVILLSRENQFDKVTSAWLANKLSGKQVVAVGGAAQKAVNSNSAIAAHLQAAYVGQDRYETAAKLVKANFAKGTEVALASGEVSADAVVAGAWAAERDGAVLLTKRETMPASVKAIIGDYRVTIFGGPATVSDQVIR